MVCLSCKGSTQSGAARKKRLNNKKDFYLNNNMNYKWAPPTWDFFHSFTAKINEDFYKSHALECLNLIKAICRVLPCPYCQQHAADFFRNIKHHDYPTKENFRQLLLNFHNDVNRRTNKASLTRADLRKYDYSVFIKITQRFLHVLTSYRGALGGAFSDTRARDAMKNHIVAWVNINYRYFS